MKLLFDQNISFRIIRKLSSIFPGCKHVSDLGLNNCEDTDIWDFAKKNNYSIVTFDSDFYDISVIKGHPPKIIWIQSGNLTTNDLIKLMNNNKAVICRFLESKEFEYISCLEIN